MPIEVAQDITEGEHIARRSNMTKRRITIALMSLLAVAAIVVGIAFGVGVFAPNSTVEAQARDGNNNNNDKNARLDQVINILRSNPGPEAAEEAVNHGMEVLIGNLRPLPSKDLLEESTRAHNEFSDLERKFAGVLEQFIKDGRRDGRSAEQKGIALNAKQMVEEMSHVATVLSQVTSQCGVGDFVLMQDVDNFNNPCSQLQPLLNSLTGLEDEPVFDIGTDQSLTTVLGPSFSTNLRADIIPPRWSRDIPENVEVTGTLAPGECSVVFKEFRGLLLQLHLERITDIRDPNNNTGVSGTTSDPIWVLQWMPAEYGKQWSMCNTGDTSAPEVTTKVTMQVVEDEGLLYFWRFYD